MTSQVCIVFCVTFIYVIMTFDLSRVNLYVQGLPLWTRRQHWLLIYGAQAGHLTARNVRHTISYSLILSTYHVWLLRRKCSA